MLIEQYEMDVSTPHCSPDSDRFAATAHLTADIREVLPYLNATLPGAHYTPDAPALTWKDGGHDIALWPHEILVSALEDRAEAVEVMDEVVRLVNDTFERRNQLEPDHTARRRLTPLEALALLPRTDCKECGQSSCYLFAIRVAAGEAGAGDCPPLQAEEFAPQLERLRARAG